MDIKKAERIAKRLIHNHLHSHGTWEFRFDNARRTFGRCWYNHQQHTGGVISLSRPLTELNNVEIVKEVILHEISHALCGHDVGHGEGWRRTVSMIGGRPRQCTDFTEVRLPASKYIAECPSCGYQKEYERRMNISCGVCDTAYNPAYRLVFKNNQAALPFPVHQAHRPQHYELSSAGTKEKKSEAKRHP